MIRSLRYRHSRIIMVLAVFVPVAFAVGIAERKPVPAANALPQEIVPAPRPFEARVWERADLFAKSPVRARLVREHRDTGRFGIVFSAGKDFTQPDLLVYWVTGSPTRANGLPENAQLLGSFSSSDPLIMPAEAATQAGVLILYSLANHEVVDTSQVIRENDASLGEIAK